MTKLDSSVDLLVLEVRPNWLEDARVHRSNPDVRILELSDVFGHYVVDPQHLGYYGVEGAKCGVTIRGADYEAAWREWSLGEIAAGVIEATAALCTHFGVAFHSDGSSEEGIPWHLIARASLGEEASVDGDSMVCSLLRHASAIDNNAANVRGHEAYLLACCVEWIDARLSRDALDVAPIGPIVRRALNESREVEYRPGVAMSMGTQAALDLLTAAYPMAFSQELPADVLGPLISLSVEARTTTPSLEEVYATLKDAARHHGDAAGLAFLLVAAAIGVELSLQLVNTTRRPRFWG